MKQNLIFIMLVLLVLGCKEEPSKEIALDVISIDTIFDDYYKEIEPAVYFVSMGNLTADENHLSYPDFIKFNALKNDIYNDPENISVSFILSLVNFKEGLLNSIFSFNTFYQSISKIVENNFAFFVIVFALLFSPP